MSQMSERSAWVLGIANFVVVSLLGGFFTWRTQDLEARLSSVKTAGGYIAIVAREEAPGYAKTLALSAIFGEDLVSRDILLEAT